MWCRPVLRLVPSLALAAQLACTAQAPGGSGGSGGAGGGGTGGGAEPRPQVGR